jgi:hypothetical protein
MTRSTVGGAPRIGRLTTVFGNRFLRHLFLRRASPAKHRRASKRLDARPLLDDGLDIFDLFEQLPYELHPLRLRDLRKRLIQDQVSQLLQTVVPRFRWLRLIDRWHLPGRRRRLACRYNLHLITGDYDDLTAAEVAALRASLKEVGLLVPIVIWNNQIVDGRHRERLCEELRILPLYQDITKVCPTEEKMRLYVAGLNEHRRSRRAHRALILIGPVRIRRPHRECGASPSL